MRSTGLPEVRTRAKTITLDASKVSNAWPTRAATNVSMAGF